MFFLKRIEAVFEVNTDLQKNVQAKITAHLTWPSVINSSQRIMFPLTNTNSSSVSRNNPPLVATCAQTHVGSIFTVLFKSSVFWNEVETSLCFSAGRGSDSAESCRRPRLCPSSPLSPVTKPICVYWKAGRPVRNLQRLQLFFFFFPSSLHLALTVIFSDFISQVAIRKFVQHQHWHKYLRVSGSQKSSECCKSDVHHYSGIQRISWLAYNCIAVLLFVAEAACGSCLSLTGSLFSWQTSLMKSSTGFVEGSTRPFVYNLLLQPGEVKSFSVRFTPISNHSVSSLLIVR